MKSIFIFTLVLMFLGVACTTAPQLSPMQKRNITTRVVDGSYDNIYRSIMTVIQDQGYIIKNTDMNSGLINAIVDRPTSGGSQFLQSLGSGFVKDKGSELDLSFMVNKISNTKSEIRINIQESKYGQSSKFSSSSKQSAKTIYDPEIYTGLFNDITVEVKRREALGRDEVTPTE